MCCWEAADLLETCGRVLFWEKHEAVNSILLPFWKLLRTITVLTIRIYDWLIHASAFPIPVTLLSSSREFVSCSKFKIFTLHRIEYPLKRLFSRIGRSTTEQISLERSLDMKVNLCIATFYLSFLSIAVTSLTHCSVATITYTPSFAGISVL